MFGIICMLLCCFFYALLNCLARYLSTTIHPLTMVFYRNFIALILILPFVIPKISAIINRESFNRLNLARGIGGFLSMAFWNYGRIFLKEKLSFDKIIALTLGFFGTYVILKPDVNGISLATIYVLMSSLIWASTNIMVKKLTKSQDAYTIVFYMALIIAPISFPWVIMHPYIPNLKELGIITLIALSSNIAQILIAKAYTKTRVTVVIPFDFTRLIFGSMIAYIMFGEILQLNTLIGSIMILIAGYLVAYMELKRKNEKVVVEAS
ncbi:integral membrane protein [Reticulomyxa filosa]|uniref:Integral membrane protein n=1 Tax=Reticulomyxa filosa TaxID=46433 RepID=X6N807_RETFI|nr:integral membrane protein [Reticulomyxa filosa]|eukprot:ETO22058.1 integral membrane protein [Reticulomyxa filosa]